MTDVGTLDTHTAVAGTQPTTQGGVVTIDSAGDATFTPAPGFVGTDDFTYTALDDDGGSGVATVTIEVRNLVDISGRVTGNIIASDKVELKSDGRMVGDIKAPRIIISDGAAFKGNVDME